MVQESKRQPINPLNAKLNPICHLLALLGAHHILHVSGLRVQPSNQTANRSNRSAVYQGSSQDNLILDDLWYRPSELASRRAELVVVSGCAHRP
jgi:hypothetical protein